jgi:hypothetical protein
MPEVNGVTLSFSVDFDERAEWEIEMKGWFEHALVHLPNGRTVQVCFWDPQRLTQDLATDVKSVKSCLAEPAMIIVPKVTIGNMKAAVEELYHNGFFDRLNSVIK